MRLTLLRCTKPGSWHVSPTPAAHTHSLAPPQHLSTPQQLSKPGLWQVSPSLQLMRTPWHHLISYQSLVFGMYRHACRSYPLLGTTSAAIKAWFRACIANACSSYALLGTTSAAISSSPIVAVRIALKRSFSGLVAFEASSKRSVFCFRVARCTCLVHRFLFSGRAVSKLPCHPKDPAHGRAVGAHRRNARKCSRRLARSSERMHMRSNGGEERHEPSYESIRSYAT